MKLTDEHKLKMKEGRERKMKEKEVVIKTTPKEIDENRILKAIGAVLEKQNGIDEAISILQKKMRKYETGVDDSFKDEATEEDIEIGKVSRNDIDPRIVKIVDNILGEDFSIKINMEDDRPGFRLDIIVPPRLSLLGEDRRPTKQLKEGKTVWEVYQPEDIRSRQIASMDSFDVIKTHCDRVRANIVATYQKLKRPLPEFKLK